MDRLLPIVAAVAALSACGVLLFDSTDQVRPTAGPPSAASSGTPASQLSSGNGIHVDEPVINQGAVLLNAPLGKPLAANGEADSMRVTPAPEMVQLLKKHGRDWRLAYIDLVGQRKRASIAAEEPFKSINDVNMNRPGDILGYLEYKGYRIKHKRFKRWPRDIERKFQLPWMIVRDQCHAADGPVDIFSEADLYPQVLPDALRERLQSTLTNLAPAMKPEDYFSTDVKFVSAVRPLMMSAQTVLETRLHVWTPPTVDHFMQTPLVVCNVLVATPSRLPRAFQQYASWGKYCSYFFIFVANAVTATGTEALGPKEVRAMCAEVGLSYDQVIFVAPRRSSTSAAAASKAANSHNVNSVRWQLLREVAAYYGQWRMMPYVDSFLLVRDDTFVIPENVYALLSRPDIATLNEAHTSLYLGQVLAIPQSEYKAIIESLTAVVGKPPANPDDDEAAAQLPDVPIPTQPQDASSKTATPVKNAFDERREFVSGGAVLLNRPAMETLAILVKRDVASCYPYFTSEADDVLLASCFAQAGILARDAVDRQGHDLFHVLPVDWLVHFGHVHGAVVMSAANPSATYKDLKRRSRADNAAWYFRDRSKARLPRQFGFDALGALSVAFMNTEPPLPGAVAGGGPSTATTWKMLEAVVASRSALQ